MADDKKQSNAVPNGDFNTPVAGEPEAKYWGDAEGWHNRGESIKVKPGANGWFSGPGIKGKR